MLTSSDSDYMRYALRLAARGVGLTAPNPSVGAVVVKDGKIIGTGVTARGGRPHAETQALAEAGTDAKGATLYVTLEPCSHQGKTPPCAQACTDAGIVKVICAVADVNPQVAGKGFAMLRAAGIEVIDDVCKEEARAINEGFFSVIERGRPFVTVKIATSLDGRSAVNPGESKWITGAPAREYGHLLRATHDAILTGIGTVLADDPALTCRIPGREQDSPLRIVLDRNLRIPLKAKMLPAWVFTSTDADKTKLAKIENMGSRVVTLASFDVPEILKVLAKEGVTRLLVEAGKTLTEAFIQQGLADRIYWFRAPLVVGDAATRIETPALTPIVEKLGVDALEIYEARKD